MKSERWESVPVRRLGTIVGGGTPAPDPSNWDGPIPFVTPPDLRPVVGGLVERTDRTLTESGATAGSSLVPQNSVLLSIRAPIGYVARTSGQVAFNQGCRALVPSPGVDPRFIVYALIAAGPELAALGRGTTFVELSAQQMATLELPAPDTREQCAIADFLDRETARIDTLIEEQQRLIVMLRARRQAVLDTVIAEVDGRRVQLRRFIQFLTSGSRGWGDYYADEGERFLRIGNLPRTRLEIRGDLQHVDLPEGVTEGERTRLQQGDLLFSITAYLGSVAVVDGEWAGGYVSQHVALCRVDQSRVHPRFVGWSMLTTAGQDQLKESAAGGTKQQLALNDIRCLRIPVTSLDAQRRIVAHLDDHTVKIDRLIAETERFIELSRERRAALITAAVTGEIDVRGEVA